MDNPINQIITKELKKKPCTKRLPATVLKLVKGTHGAKVEIKVHSTDFQKSRITVLNKSNDELFVGDEVWIYYWRTLSDGYIKLRNGYSDLRFFKSLNPADYQIWETLYTGSYAKDSYRFFKTKEYVSKQFEYSVEESQVNRNIFLSDIGEVTQIIRDGDVERYLTSIKLNTGEWLTLNKVILSNVTQFETYKEKTIPTRINGEIVNCNYKAEVESGVIYLVRYHNGIREELFSGWSLGEGEDYAFYCNSGFNFSAQYDPNLQRMIYSITFMLLRGSNNNWESASNSWHTVDVVSSYNNLTIIDNFYDVAEDITVNKEIIEG